MATVIAMRKQLRKAPERFGLPQIELRNFEDQRDIPRWLDLQARALPHSVKGRAWDERDFAREFLQQPWWNVDRMWFALSRGEDRRTVGTVTWGERGMPQGSLPSIHWLLVDPDYRRQGIGRLLVAALEEACWQSGRTTLALETLSLWSDAMAFYTALGYHAI